VAASVPGLFSVDYESGAVRLLARAEPRHSPMSLLVRAKDGGQPALSATLPCTVHVRDVNDHAPVFTAAITKGDGGEGMMEFHVDERAPVGHELGRILAVFFLLLILFYFYFLINFYFIFNLFNLV
jgi:hypothetical protein